MILQVGGGFRWLCHGKNLTVDSPVSDFVLAVKIVDFLLVLLDSKLASDSLEAMNQNPCFVFFQAGPAGLCTCKSLTSGFKKKKTHLVLFNKHSWFQNGHMHHERLISFTRNQLPSLKLT